MTVSRESMFRGAVAGATAVALLAIGISSPAQATVTAGSSYAAGEAVNLDFTPIIGLAATITSGPLPTFSGTSPGAYGSSNTVLGVNVAGVLSTGVLTAGGVSNVNGGAGSRSTTAFAQVDGLSLLSALGLTLGASTILSTAGVSGDYGALNGSGSTTIEDLSLNGVPIVTASIPVGDVILNALGITVALNVQTSAGDGISTRTASTDAILVEFTNAPYVLGLTPGVLNGSIEIAHSVASESASPSESVPEPATLALLCAGMLGLVAVRRLSKEA